MNQQVGMFDLPKPVYKLRPYQQEMVEAGIRYIKVEDKPSILVAATGAGKSLVIAGIAKGLDRPTLVLQPSKELLEQNYEKMLNYDVPNVTLYSASVNSKDSSGDIVMATIQSIYKKPEEFKRFGYVIIDECHGVNPKNLGGMYTSFLEAIQCKHVLGLTATPYRMTQKFFKRDGELIYTSKLSMINRIHPFFWKSVRYKVETHELIQQGYLAPIVYRMPEDVDIGELEVNTTGRDYTEESLERFWNDKRLRKLASTIELIDQHCQRSLIFCSSLRHAGRTEQLLATLGIQAHIVSGNTPKNEREELVKRYRAGEFKHLINVGVFTTGFDVPEMDCVILARPTMSLALYYQMVGRGVRKDPKRPEKVLRVYDLAGVVKRLGRIETIKLEKEEGWKDMVVSEAGRMDNVPLFEFAVKDAKKKARFGA